MKPKVENNLLLRSPLADYEILVCGLARNCGFEITSSLDILSQALKGAKRVRWLVIESDSDDGTVSALQSISEKNSDFEYRSLGKLRHKMPKRTDRISYCRNYYLSEIASNHNYKNVFYVVVADLDGVNNNLTRSAFESCWERNDWDACMANQDGPYYDIWALRHPLWSPVDCWEQYKLLRKFEVEPDAALSSCVYSKMINIPASADWLEVDSAFGGLAIYKRKFIILGKYRGLTHDNEEVCEHVPFHLDLRNRGARLFINPKMINTDFTDHSERLRFWTKIKYDIRRLIRAIVRHIF